MSEMWRKMSVEERGILIRKCNIVADEKYKDLCRITAEKFEAGHIAAVFCIQGGAIESLTFEEEEFWMLFPKMKQELALLLDRDLEADDRGAELDQFFARYTSANVYKRKLLGEKR